MATVQLPDGSEKTYTSPCTVQQVAESINSRLAKTAIAGKIDDKVVGLDTTLPEDSTCRVEILTNKDAEALDVMRHSCAHVMARAIMRLFPGVQLAFGPTTEEGFYYDFDSQHALSDDDFPAIEAEMKRLVQLDETFERIEIDRESAIEVCGDLKQTLKVEHIKDGFAEHDQVSFYQNGEFLALCHGPHVKSAAAIGAFKLLSVADAYWKEDPSRQQLQRIYATAFFTTKELDEQLARIE